jgi:hypothetical protein
MSTNIANQKLNFQIYFQFLCFFYEFTKINVHILLNPNYVLKGRNEILNYKEIKCFLDFNIASLWLN